MVVPKGAGMSFVSCELEARTGGRYRFVFAFDKDPSQPMAFYGRYLEVVPPTRLVWTNEENGAGEEGHSITTVTFEEEDGKTRMVLRELYPSKQALEEALASGAVEGANQHARSAGRAARHSWQRVTIDGQPASRSRAPAQRAAPCARTVSASSSASRSSWFGRAKLARSSVRSAEKKQGRASAQAAKSRAKPARPAA